MPDLALALLEHLPARFVGMPVRAASQLIQTGIGHRPQHRQQLAQPLGERALRNVQPLVVPVLQKPVAGLPIEELRQQRLHPDRHAELASRNELRGRRRRHDAGQTATTTYRPVAVSAHDAAVRLDLDLHNLGILSARERAQPQTAARTLRLQRHLLDPGWQRLRAGTAMAAPPTLLAPRPCRAGADLAARVDRARLFRLGTKHTQAKIADLRLRDLQRRPQLDFTLRESFPLGLMPTFHKLDARHRSRMQVLV
uniref:Uncharacterized protein n=1 Tax=mine drainage metagenome TaxID=410659 RepID=E6PKG0_9ZZZZ